MEAKKNAVLTACVFSLMAASWVIGYAGGANNCVGENSGDWYDYSTYSYGDYAYENGDGRYDDQTISPDAMPKKEEYVPPETPLLIEV